MGTLQNLQQQILQCRFRKQAERSRKLRGKFGFASSRFCTSLIFYFVRVAKICPTRMLKFQAQNLNFAVGIL